MVAVWPKTLATKRGQIAVSVRGTLRGKLSKLVQADEARNDLALAKLGSSITKRESGESSADGGDRKTA
jgi:hypothetical protein